MASGDAGFQAQTQTQDDSVPNEHEANGVVDYKASSATETGPPYTRDTEPTPAHEMTDDDYDGASREHSVLSTKDEPDFEPFNPTVGGQQPKPREDEPAPPQKTAAKAPVLDRRPSSIDPSVVFHRLHRFSLYETNARYYITGADITDRHYKVLKIDRTAAPGNLNIFEDNIVYTKQELTHLLTAIDDGNKATGGLRIKFSFWGLVGFIRFTESYYMLLITKRQQVAMIGGHYVYQIEGTELVPLTTGASTRFARDRNPEEARFLGILNNLDLSKSFYFSYAYNITTCPG